jgi:DNA-binding NtrC family response regulator
VAVNCSAFASNLLESELFGFQKGAFTGADRDREGLVETAHRGTLFLDEIAEMDPDLQSKLLRVIEEREVRRLGENRTRPVDVRIVAATHRDLRARVAEGKFREDLYFRINVVTLELPPLREREGDVLLLAEHFLEEQRTRLERPGLRLSREALAVLRTHRWPGNVRELRNVIERAAALAPDDEIGPDDLGSELAGDAPARLPRGGSLREILDAAERAAIEDALREAGGVVTRAAERLGVTRQHLHNRLKKFGIDAARHRG